MGFTKRFPKDIPNSRYPEWVDVSLTDAEEAKVEGEAREIHVRQFTECLSDARQALEDVDLGEYQTNVLRAAVALFEKRASHTVWHKEEAAREKFEEEHKD